jgi:hypothetical protein
MMQQGQQMVQQGQMQGQMMMNQGQMQGQQMVMQGQQMMMQGQEFVGQQYQAAKKKLKKKVRHNLSEEELKKKLKEVRSRCPPFLKVARKHFQAFFLRQTEDLD